jgi:hypothetical protein
MKLVVNDKFKIAKKIEFFFCFRFKLKVETLCYIFGTKKEGKRFN